MHCFKRNFEKKLKLVLANKFNAEYQDQLSQNYTNFRYTSNKESTSVGKLHLEIVQY